MVLFGYVFSCMALRSYAQLLCLLLSRLESKFLGLQQIFRYTLMTLLKHFILRTFLCVNSKKEALGILGLLRLAVLTLITGIKIFGPQKNF